MHWSNIIIYMKQCVLQLRIEHKYQAKMRHKFIRKEIQECVQKNKIYDIKCAKISGVNVKTILKLKTMYLIDPIAN